MFEGRNKLLPLPVKPIVVESPFQQWKLYFIGEIHPSLSRQHKWILTGTNYFTKWIEVVPTRQATDATIIQFLENNILSLFGCPQKIITDNVVAFKSKNMIEFCYKYNIILSHSTAYYPKGNGLAKSSNKSFVNIIKNLLQENKRNLHKKLIHALWTDHISSKSSICMSLFELVYGKEALFPSSLRVLVMRLLQEEKVEPSDMQWRIDHMIQLQQSREEVFKNTQLLQARIKKIYDKRTKETNFQIGELVLKWDAQNEDKGKHGKFKNLWKGPFKFVASRA